MIQVSRGTKVSSGHIAISENRESNLFLASGPLGHLFPFFRSDNVCWIAIGLLPGTHLLVCWRTGKKKIPGNRRGIDSRTTLFRPQEQHSSVPIDRHHMANIRKHQINITSNDEAQGERGILQDEGRLSLGNPDRPHTSLSRKSYTDPRVHVQMHPHLAPFSRPAGEQFRPL